jgi:hypothetical protein
MEVLCIPTLMTAAVQINKCNNFINWGAAVGYLGKSLVGKALKTTFFVTVNVAAKGAVTYTEDQGGLFLSQAVF